MKLFEDIGICPDLLKCIKDLGIEKTTVIQGKSIPHIIEGKDIIGESATGSGKTIAFGCGIVQHTEPKQGIQALILAPTRELAEQVRGSLKEISKHKKLKIISVYGGVSINPQMHDLQSADVVVGTPGRLLDHMQRNTINLSKVKILVLDEADRMLDMGFIDDVEKIIKQCPKKRQTLFFSATISPDIKRLAKNYMNNPINVFADNQVDPSKLKQEYYDIQKNMKLSLLAHLLEQEKKGLVMVFCNSRNTVDFVVNNLKRNRIDAISIHGGLTQNKRSYIMKLFNDKKVHVLVCTDVAARGLHIENVSHVYNYEIPKDSKDYVHRIGRTARAGEEGKVINLLSDYDHDNFSRVLREYPDFKIQKMQKPYVKRLISIRNDDSGFRRRGNSNQRFPRRPGFQKNLRNRNRKMIRSHN